MALEVTAENVAEYLRRRGLIPSGPASVEELGGGVSSRVFLVAAPSRRLVVKQPLPRFRVHDEWLVDTSRVRVEADFLRLVGARLPRSAVPEFVAFDEAENVLVVAAAPNTFRPWKATLLTGRPDAELAVAAARLLARIHRIGADEPSLRTSFDQARLFDQQRIDPYLRALVARHPRRAAPLQALIKRLEADRTTLIHGDFSPKNMLTDGRSLLLVDHEVATWNDPLFDVCFLINHLILKAFHRPPVAHEFGEVAQTFLETYQREATSAAKKRLAEPSHLLPALMLARIDGKSPVEYLSEDARTEVGERAGKWLDAPPRTTLDYVARTILY